MNSGLLSYDDITREMSVKIMKFLDTFCAFESLEYGNEVKLQSKFDEYYEDLKKKISNLNEIKKSLQSFFKQIKFDDYEAKLIRSIETNLKTHYDNLYNNFEQMLNG
jgi:hypothetical protein